MRHPPVKRTPEVDALLLEQGQLRSRTLTMKQIAMRIGASKTYVQEQLSRIVTAERKKIVSHETTGTATLHPGRYRDPGQ